MDIILNIFVTLLTFLYRVFGHDMVLSIAVFTILVRLLTLPLTIQQQRSTRAMQKLQPELKKLQEKYKNDREKLSQEQMAMYREYGINPLGGCLPLLIQFPIFIALYSAINMALAATPTQMLDTGGRLLIPGLDSVIPLNNLWLGMDLTQPPDMSIIGTSITSFIPIVLIILVGATTWLQFKVTMPKQQPNANSDGKPDQAQAMSQSMGTIMPIMYMFFTLSFSVGLSIYFIVSNLVGIVQFSLINRMRLKDAASADAGTSLMTVEGKTPKIRPASESAKKNSAVANPKGPSGRAVTNKSAPKAK